MKLELEQKLKSLAPTVLRLGLAAVMVWFGASQFNNPNAWTSLVPSWATDLSGMSALTIVHLNAVFELIAGALVAVGFGTRWLALLLSAHLFVITLDLGASAVGVRDFGLSLGLFAVALYGTDDYCIEKK